MTIGAAVALIYLRLPDVGMSIERVRRRVAQGGNAKGVKWNLVE
jgi:predicted ABC-type ATPase